MPSSHLILCHPSLPAPNPSPASGSFPMSQLFALGTVKEQGDRAEKLSTPLPTPAGRGSRVHFYKMSLFVSPKGLSYRPESLPIPRSRLFCWFSMPELLRNWPARPSMWRCTWISTGCSSQMQAGTRGSRPLPRRRRPGLPPDVRPQEPDSLEALVLGTSSAQLTAVPAPGEVQERWSFVPFRTYSFRSCFESTF